MEGSLEQKKTSDGRFYWLYRHQNGNVIAKSKFYYSEDVSILSQELIVTLLIKGAGEGEVVFYRGVDGEYRWRMPPWPNTFLLQSSEGYINEEDCRTAFKNLMADLRS